MSNSIYIYNDIVEKKGAFLLFLEMRRRIVFFKHSPFLILSKESTI